MQSILPVFGKLLLYLCVKLRIMCAYTNEMDGKGLATNKRAFFTKEANNKQVIWHYTST